MNSISKQFEIVALMFLTWGLCGLARSSIAYLFPYFSADFALTESENGYLVAIAALFWAISIITTSKLAAKYGQVKIMTSVIGIGSGALLLMSLVQTKILLYLAVAIFGYGCGAVVAPSITLIVEHITPTRRGMCMGIMMSGFTLIGAAIGASSLTWVGEKIGWRSTYMLLAIAVFIIAVLVRVRLEKLPRRIQQKESKRPLNEVFCYKNIRIAIALTAIGMTWYFSVTAYLILYLTQVKALSITESGIVFSALGIGGFLGEMFISAVSDYLGRKTTAFFSTLLGTIAFLIFLFAPLNIGGLSIALFWSAFLIYGCFPMFTSVIPSEAVPSYLVSQVTSLTPAIGEIIGGFFAPALIGICSISIDLENLISIIGFLPFLNLFFALCLIENAPIKKKALG